MTGLVLAGMTVGHGDHVVLSGVTARARPGEVTVLLGPNGVGKSTLLRTLAGLLAPLGGSARLDDVDLTRVDHRSRARRVAVVLPRPVVTGRLTVRELVALGRHPHTGFTGAFTERDHRVVDWALDAVDVAGLARRDVGELSDGQRQRAFIARALAQEPGLLLLDEPSAFLDAPSRVGLMALLRELAGRRGLVVLASTHEVELALRVADSAWLIDRSATVRTGLPEQLAVDGHIGAVFDTDRLRYQPDSGTFHLRASGVGTCQVSGPDAEVVRRIVARAGWTVVDDDRADLRLSAGPVGYLGSADGLDTPLSDYAAVDAWIRRQRR